MAGTETISVGGQRTGVLDRIRKLLGMGRRYQQGTNSPVGHGETHGRDPTKYWFTIQRGELSFGLGCDTPRDLKEVARLFAALMEMNNNDFEATHRMLMAKCRSLVKSGEWRQRPS